MHDLFLQLKLLSFFFIALNLSQNISAQNNISNQQQAIDSVTQIIEPFPFYYKKGKFWNDQHQKISKKQINLLLTEDSIAVCPFRDGQNLTIYAGLTGFIGSVMVGYSITNYAIAKSKPNRIVTISTHVTQFSAGISCIAISGLLTFIKDNKFKKTAHLYNTQHNFTAYRPILGVTPNGIGLVLKW